MASPSSVLTLGFGSWGSVGDVVRLGYGAGEISLPDYGAIQFSCLPHNMTFHCEPHVSQFTAPQTPPGTN